MNQKRCVRACGALLTTAVLALGASACGSSSKSPSKAASGSSNSSSQVLTTLNVNLIPVPDLAPVYVGEKQGFFAQHHLKLNITQSPGGGPEVIPAVLSGKAQIGAPAWSDLILAVSKGLPLVAVSSCDTGGPTDASDDQFLTVLKRSGITSLKQLVGKTVAVNSLAGESDVEVHTALKKAGINPNSVHYVAINFPQQAAALSAGRVQAAAMVEPFLTLMKKQGITKLTGLDYAIAPSLPTAVFLASRSYYSSHTAVIHDFQAAIKQSQLYIEAHPDAARQVVPQFTGVSAALATQIVMPHFPTTVSLSALRSLETDMKGLGVISKEPALSSFVKTGSS